jgi:hypothetical protein
MPDWETAKALGLELPDTVEGTSYGMPALKVRDKMFARLREDGETLVVWTDFLEREALTQGDPETFFITPHYEDYPLVLIGLEHVDAEELRELLIESWRQRAPKRVLRAYDEAEGT